MRRHRNCFVSGRQAKSIYFCNIHSRFHPSLFNFVRLARGITGVKSKTEVPFMQCLYQKTTDLCLQHYKKGKSLLIEQ